MEAPFLLSAGQWGANIAGISINLAFTPAPSTGLTATSRGSGSLSIPANFPYYFEGLQLVTTSAAALSVGGVSPLGYCVLHNADPTNYISLYGQSGGTELARLLPGDWSMIRLAPSATPFVKANVASCQLEIYLVSS
jgi:hypothetical protein